MKNVKQFLVGGMIRKVKIEIPGRDSFWTTVKEDWGTKVKTDDGDFEKKYITHEVIADKRHIKKEGGKVSENHNNTSPKLNNEGGYDYSNSDQKTAKKVGLITLPKDVESTNCGNCIFFNSDFCYHKKIKLPVTSRMCCSFWDSKGILNAITDIADVSFGEAGAIADTKLNDNGGLDYSGEAIEKAKNADLITLPKDVFGTNCANCQFFSDGNCGNKNVMLPVTGRMSCSLWNNKEVNRSWGEMKEIFFKIGGSIKKLLTGGEVGTPEWTNEVITRANIDFDVLQMNPVAEDYVKYIKEELKLQCENPKQKSEKYYRDWLLTQEASMKSGGKTKSVKSKLKSSRLILDGKDAAMEARILRESNPEGKIDWDAPRKLALKSVKSKLKNSGLITVKTPRSEKTISVGGITAEEAIKTVKDKYPNFTEFEYKKITYKKTGKKGEFIKRIDPPEAIEARWQKKKDAIRQLSENIRSLRNTVSRDLNSSDEKTALTALAVAIMDKTAERPGNDESASYVKQSKNDKRKRAYGVTGFKRGHVTILGNKVHLNYIGKKGVPQEKSFSDDKIAKALKKAMKNCKGEFIFETDNCNITASIVNEYLEPFHVTAKNIRGYSANRWVLDKLKSITPEDSDKKRKKQLSGVLKQIAERVGHGPSVLRNQYLMPEVMDTWIEKGELFDMKKAGYVMKGGGSVKTKLKNGNKKTAYDGMENLSHAHSMTHKRFLSNISHIEKSSSDVAASELSDDPIISRAHDKDTKNIQVGGNYQFKNNHGSFTSVKVMPVNENFVRSKDFFTVEVSVRGKDGDNTVIQTKHKTFPIAEYGDYMEDLKKRIQ